MAVTLRRGNEVRTAPAVLVNVSVTRKVDSERKRQSAVTRNKVRCDGLPQIAPGYVY